MKKRKVHVRRAALVGLFTLANGVVAIATDYSDFEPRAFAPLATVTVATDYARRWEPTGAPRSEEAVAVRPGYFGIVHPDQENDG